MSHDFVYVAAIHGDELQPGIALQERRIPYITGNPRAAEQKSRFIDIDLNSCFGKTGEGYEYGRAADLLEIIPSSTTVIDFHTFSCVSDPFAIVTQPQMLPLAKRLGLKHIVFMKHDIKAGHSLISHRSGVSVEVGAHDSLQAHRKTHLVLDTLHSARPVADIKCYEAFDTIEEGGDYENFCSHEKGFIPVLSGERAYKHFGLKVRAIS